MGNFTGEGIIEVLEDAYRETWNGELKAATDSQAGTLWLVRGQAIHAKIETEQESIEGMTAFEEMVSWQTGSYVFTEGTLPPARTIRLPMADLILASKQSARRESISREEKGMHVPKPLHTRLDGILEGLRSRVPGIETLSVYSPDSVETDSKSEGELQEWIRNQLKLLSAQDSAPETMYMKHHGRMLLVLGEEQELTVLSASDSTAPEALFWAGQEARRRLKMETADTARD